MSAARNDGGPAFPTVEQVDRHGDPTTYADSGMSLRDYFAAKAMQGMLASDINATESSFAQQAYKMADAMLEARTA